MTTCDPGTGAIGVSSVPGNPVAEVCGNGVDENCNGNGGQECIDCPDGGALTINDASYNVEDQKLDVKGRSHTTPTIMLLNADTGMVLADGIKVEDDGKWKVELEHMNPAKAPLRLEASNGEGCIAEKDVFLRGIPETDNHEDNDERWKRRERRRHTSESASPKRE
jgi:hypothetical protein